MMRAFLHVQSTGLHMKKGARGVEKMSRNFGWGQRDMSAAARIALQSTNASFSSVATHVERFSQFKDFCKEQGVGRMERITPELVREFGQTLANKVDSGELSAAYAQNIVSSVNSVMHAATRGNWKSVSPTRECNIAQRCNVRTEHTPERQAVTRVISEMRASGAERQAAIAALALDLGLRSKEASLLNASRALNEAQTRGFVTISDGTKGGRERVVPITNPRQIQTLQQASQVQGSERSMIPSGQNWKSFRENELRNARETLQNAVGGGLHDLRATYASERYQALVGHSAPCNGGKIADRQLDREARQQIAEELGHGRIDVVSSYIGGR